MFNETSLLFARGIYTCIHMYKAAIALFALCGVASRHASNPQYHHGLFRTEGGREEGRKRGRERERERGGEGGREGGREGEREGGSCNKKNIVPFMYH